MKDRTYLVKQMVSSLGQRRQWNFALGIGPMIDGKLPACFDPMIENTGRFLAWAGESIYDTSASSAAEPAASTPSKPAVERKDGYFGIHFDLHPNKSDTVLGRDVTEDNIRAFLRRVRPDYVQYDCVGVPGYSGYPTKVGWSAPGIVKDSLAVWRKVTREERVALLIHYCVLWNQAAVAHHPDWAAVNAQGVREKEVLSNHETHP